MKNLSVKKTPFVSIIIPCLNEERFIKECMESILEQDYPKDKIEVLVVDGMSKDKTREIVEEFSKNYSFLKILDNPRIITPAAMNIGIKSAVGEIVIKMDAHSIYEKDYVSKCVKYLRETGADNVGGVLSPIPAKNTITAKAIAFSLSSFFGAGGSYFRTGTSKPREVDTVAFGCYPKKVFEKIGLFDEKMAKIEDLELNYRIRKSGGKIMLFPDIKAFYYPTSYNLKGFFRHNFTDGVWTTYPLRFGFFFGSLRHFIPLFFTALLIDLLILSFFFKVFLYILLAVMGFYLLCAVLFSFPILAKEKDLRYFLIMPIVFFIRHFGYGLGSIWGILKAIIK